MLDLRERRQLRASVARRHSEVGAGHAQRVVEVVGIAGEGVGEELLGLRAVAREQVPGADLGLHVVAHDVQAHVGEDQLPDVLAQLAALDAADADRAGPEERQCIGSARTCGRVAP